MGELPARFPVQRLQPQIVLISLSTDGIHHSAPIRSEFWPLDIADNNLLVGIKNLDRLTECVALEYSKGFPIIAGRRAGYKRWHDQHGVVSGNIGDRKRR